MHLKLIPSIHLAHRLKTAFLFLGIRQHYEIHPKIHLILVCPIEQSILYNINNRHSLLLVLKDPRLR